MFSKKLGEFENIIFTKEYVKILLYILVPLCVFFLLVVFGVYRIVYKIEFSQWLEHESIHVDVAKSIIVEKLEHTSSDLHILSNQTILKEFIVSDTSYNRERIQGEYVNFSLAKKVYDQIRYIDEKGMEKIRVNYRNGIADIVSGTKLQNKKNRYYFRDSLRLKQGEIYVSPFDLNIEQGKIELPQKPMLRFGTPVFSRKNVKKGVVVLNYLGADILDVLDGQSFDLIGKLMLVNMDGYWLKSPNKEDEWGFMYEDKKEITFAKRYPKQWSKIKEKDAGFIDTLNGLFIFNTIYSFKETTTYSKSEDISNGMSNAKISDGEYSWKIISHIDSDSLNVLVSQFRRNYIYLYISLFVFLFVLSVIISYMIKKKMVMDYHLKESQSRYKILFESSGDAIFIMKDNVFLDCNHKALELFECSYDQIIGRYMSEFSSDTQESHADPLAKLDSIFSEVLKEKEQQFEWKYRSYKGHIFEAEVGIKKIVIGNEFYLQVVIRDVTQRKKSERQIRKYSETQTILLQEVNHRVKNNLAALISMLHMEESSMERGKSNKSFSELLNGLINRIEGLATVHSMLSASKWSPIKLSTLCRKIIEGSKKGLPFDKVSTLEVVTSDIVVNSTQAHHLTLIINELTTNSIKHAIKDDRSFDIQVNIKRVEDMVEIVYRDNGPGFPEDIIGQDYSNVNIGFKLIIGVTRRSLLGDVVFSNDNGAVSRITFPLEKLL